MKIPTEFAPQSWEMPPDFHILEDSASVVTRDFDGAINLFVKEK